MSRALIVLIPALIGSGCAPDLIDGVWQFSMQATDQAEETCTETISHNFTFGWVDGEDDEEDPDWTETTDESYSDQIFYGLITSTGPDAATLIIGTDAYPGVHESDGAWTFTWTGMSTSSDNDTHASGYQYSATSDQTREVTFTLQQDGDVLNGTEDADVSTVQDWSESDGWNPRALQGYLGGGGASGKIPSGTYLVTNDDDPKSPPGATVPQYNEAESSDCDDDLCLLNRMFVCNESWPIDAVRTTLSTGEDYEGVVGAGQASGY